MYNYSWGDDYVLSSRVQVFKEGHERYRVIFEQEAFEYGHCQDIVTKHILLSKTKEYIDSDPLNILRIIIRVRAILNPPPEDIFSIVTSCCMICGNAGSSICNDCAPILSQ